MVNVDLNGALVSTLFSNGTTILFPPSLVVVKSESTVSVPFIDNFLS